METASAALKAGDDLVAELQGGPLKREVSAAPTMGNLKKVSYTHEAMIELIIKDPWISQRAIALHFGYTEGWISNILASDALQSRMAARRDEIINPELKATIEERFRALVIQSLKVLQDKLNEAKVSDTVAIRAAELGAKALGIGGHAPVPPAPPTDRLERLAERLITLQAGVRERTLNGRDGVSVEIIDGKAGGNAAAPESA